MKLVKSQIANSDSIVTDDGIILGMIYYGTQPIDDAGMKPAERFRKWFEAANILSEAAAHMVTIAQDLQTVQELARTHGASVEPKQSAETPLEELKRKFAEMRPSSIEEETRTSEQQSTDILAEWAERKLSLDKKLAEMNDTAVSEGDDGLSDEGRWADDPAMMGDTEEEVQPPVDTEK